MPEKLNFDEERCLNFWEGGNSDRPLISFWIGSFLISDLYPNSMNLLPNGSLLPHQIQMELFQQDFGDLFKKNSHSVSDVPWAAFPIMTIPWLEAILGCQIMKKGSNIWAEPFVEDYEQFINYDIDLQNNPWLDKLLDFTKWLVSFAEGLFPVSTCLMRGPSDLLSALRSPSRMCLDFYDFPEKVSLALDKITDVWIKVAKFQHELIPEFMGGYSFGQIYLWGKEKCGWFQDDAIALLSPKFYKQYFLPREEIISASLPRTGIHLHPNSLFVIDQLTKLPGLDVIEINYEPTGPSLKEMLPYLEQVTDHKKLVLWGDFSNQDLKFLRAALPAKNLCLQIIAENPGIAQSKKEKILNVWQNDNIPL